MSGECNAASVRYRTIVADPPWHYEAFGGYNQSAKGQPRTWVERSLPYSSMTVAEISAVCVQEFAQPDCNLFLWTTNRYLPAAFAVLQAWGFAYRQLLVWHKSGANPNTGAVAPTSCEFVLYARIGTAGLTSRFDDAVLSTKRIANTHSRKPEAFMDLVEQVSPGPYLELFARRQRLGWDTWGNEALEHVELSA